jgi:hypothetical protein
MSSAIFIQVPLYGSDELAEDGGRMGQAGSSRVRQAGQGTFAGVAQMKRLNVSKTPEQSQRDDRNYGDHAEISELLSNGLMLLHFSTS